MFWSALPLVGRRGHCARGEFDTEGALAQLTLDRMSGVRVCDMTMFSCSREASVS